MKKRILVAMATGLLLMGTTATCLAANGLTYSITYTTAKASFTNAPDMGSGQTIEVRQQVTEQIDGGKDTFTTTHHDTAVGMTSTVSTTRKVDDGYSYVCADWTRGYVNGSIRQEYGRRVAG